MHITTHSILVVLLYVVVGVDAIKVFRSGNGSGPVTKITTDDFKIKNGQAVPSDETGLPTGLSTYESIEAYEAATKRTNQQMYSINLDDVKTAGFGFRADGHEVGGSQPRGHHTIFVKTAVDVNTLWAGLNNVDEPLGPGVLKWTN